MPSFFSRSAGTSSGQRARRSVQARQSTPFAFNLGEHLTARDNTDAYPSYLEFWAQSNTDNPQEGFQDLYRSDFISAVGRVSRRKMDRLEASPYHYALLKRGISKREEEEDCDVSLRQGMEYTGAVGVGLLEMVNGLADKTDVQVSGLDLTVTDLETRVQEVETRQTNLGGMQGVLMEAWGAAMNAQDMTQDIQLTIERVGDLSTRMDDTELVHMEVDERLHVVERDAAELKMDVTMLVAERETNREQMERAGQRWEQIRDVVVDQQGMITDLHNLVDLLREQILALQHGAGNPIVIEDFGGTDSEDSDSDYDDNDVVMFYPAPEGLLVPIEDDEETAVTSEL